MTTVTKLAAKNENDIQSKNDNKSEKRHQYWKRQQKRNKTNNSTPKR